MRDVHHHANECLALAHGHLSGRHSTERILRAWGGARRPPTLKGFRV
jgi:hypothetical protein